MVESKAPEQPLHNVAVRHERTDASFGCILAIGIFFVLLGALVFGIIFRSMNAFSERDKQMKDTRYPLTTEKRDSIPPAPRLEGIDRLLPGTVSESTEALESKAASLHAYGPASEPGYVRIPIERAMELLLQQKSLKHRALDGVPSDSGRKEKR
jgi:hypothetical protein